MYLELFKNKNNQIKKTLLAQRLHYWSVGNWNTHNKVSILSITTVHHTYNSNLYY